ncbi:universal stress protein [Microbacterium sulfonylureivorans]|uniref:universal stress protein n=1 Tax=Microbacterium sulfonylureivorans TaxID=2486854 RepID=UPI001F0C9F21|nr:universal stress protein [Microbacterium sulfonylureivorans]
MERIVLGYDGSPAAVSALSWTAARAARGTTRVDVVLVASPFTRDRAPGLERLGEAEAFLRDRLPGLEVELHRLDGSVTESIAEAAEDADMVVIGIHPGHPIRAAAAGWTPLRLSTRANAPVCMVPAGWTEGGDPVTVGVADDSSSNSAIDFGVAEATATGVSLRLVHSWLMPSPTFDYGTAITVDPAAVIEDHRRTLSAAVERVLRDAPSVPVESELIRDSRSAALLRFASRSSLLLIGTHRRGVLAGTLLGSVAQEVLWRADCPVCVVPPQRGEKSVSELTNAAEELA